jgi:hypothetical protein
MIGGGPKKYVVGGDVIIEPLNDRVSFRFPFKYTSKKFADTTIVILNGTRSGTFFIGPDVICVESILRAATYKSFLRGSTYTIIFESLNSVGNTSIVSVLCSEIGYGDLYSITRGTVVVMKSPFKNASNEIVYCTGLTETKLQLRSDVIGDLVKAVCFALGTGILIIPESPGITENIGTPKKCRAIAKIAKANKTTDAKNVYLINVEIIPGLSCLIILQYYLLNIPIFFLC